MNFATMFHKRKGERISEAFIRGAKSQGHTCRLLNDAGKIDRDEIGVFYGVVKETRRAFEECMDEGRAIYLDNGWLSRPGCTTLRWAWNGVQSRGDLLEPDYNRLGKLFGWPSFKEYTLPDTPPSALLCLQSPGYFDHANLPMTADEWQKHTTRILRKQGYDVEVRSKPTTHQPALKPLLSNMRQHHLVVSVNSAVSTVAITHGIPAFCTFPSTLIDICPQDIPPSGELLPLRRTDVAPILAKVASADFTYEELENGEMVKTLLAVPPEHRKGHYYGRDTKAGKDSKKRARRLASQG